MGGTVCVQASVCVCVSKPGGVVASPVSPARHTRARPLQQPACHLSRPQTQRHVPAVSSLAWNRSSDLSRTVSELAANLSCTTVRSRSKRVKETLGRMTSPSASAYVTSAVGSMPSSLEKILSPESSALMQLPWVAVSNRPAAMCLRAEAARRVDGGGRRDAALQRVRLGKCMRGCGCSGVGAQCAR